MKSLVALIFGAGLLVGCPVWAQQYCDNMETPLWALGHENPVYDGSWFAQYTTAAAHSPNQSIRTSLHGGGTVGLDSDRAYAIRSFPVCSGVVESLSVWYNSMGIGTGAGPIGLDAHCRVKVTVGDCMGEVIGSVVYCVACFDDNGEHQNHENIPGWIYQESRPDEYEPGAPDYSRLPDGSIQPPVGWWYRLKVSPAADLDVNWCDVACMTVELSAFGCFMNADNVGMYWDDYCHILTTGPSATDESSWSRMKMLFRE